MQNAMDSPSQNWLQITLTLLAAFLAGGGITKVIAIYRKRHHPTAEIHESIARARKINAEADVELNGIIERLHIRIDDLGIRIETVTAERDKFRNRCEQNDIEIDLYEYDRRQMKALLDLHGISYSSKDAPRLSPTNGKAEDAPAEEE